MPVDIVLDKWGRAAGMSGGAPSWLKGFASRKKPKVGVVSATAGAGGAATPAVDVLAVNDYMAEELLQVREAGAGLRAFGVGEGGLKRCALRTGRGKPRRGAAPPEKGGSRRRTAGAASSAQRAHERGARKGVEK